MKNLTFTLILTLLSFFSFSQTKSNQIAKVDKTTTANWIKEKLVIYSPIVYNPTNQQDVTIIRTVTIENCMLIIKDTGEGAFGYEQFEIPLFDIYIPTFYSNPEWPTNMRINFITKSRQKNIIRKLVIYSNPDSNEFEYINQASVKIHKSCLQENMTDKFKKAFKDMINFCGGNAVDELY